MELDNGRVVFGDATKEDPTATDPVCGMEIKRVDAAAVAERDGTIYYFCSPACKQRFVEEPERYVTPAASP
ncbi:MAG TPA: YHS domain-containing protein [Polyangia bacterium]|jgi:Cu+-exporting ATPase|nr:YHS domain-containing protein [Polyangia bacterium]